MEKLPKAAPGGPDAVPEFLRTPEAIAQIAQLGRELDRSRESGRVHDSERDPGHYIDLDDDGTAFGIIPFSPVASNREDYDTALRARGTTQYKLGYLPYAIVDGWQQLVKDFAYWRVLAAVSKPDGTFAPGTDQEVRTWATADRKLRELILLRDLGVWSHYVGDGSQPLHTSVHFNGWGPFPNPRGYAVRGNLHGRVEGPFVRSNITHDMVAEKVGLYQPRRDPIDVWTMSYLRQTRQTATALYDLEAKGSFWMDEKDGSRPKDPAAARREGAAFVAARLAAGATELRDMIAAAWDASLESRVGYPEMSVKELLADPTKLKPTTFGGD